MKIKFWKNTKEDNNVNVKDVTGTPILDLTGTLREGTSVITPEIVIESDTKILTCNYCYIEEFSRYYFIKDIQPLTNRLWKLSLSVDVCYTYRDYIYAQTGFVERNETRFNPLIEDKERDMLFSEDWNMIPCSFYQREGAVVDKWTTKGNQNIAVTFASSAGGYHNSDENKSYYAYAVDNYIEPPTKAFRQLVGFNIPDYVSVPIVPLNMRTTTGFEYTNMTELVKKFKSDNENPIANVCAFPFDIEVVQGVDTAFKVNVIRNFYDKSVSPKEVALPTFEYGIAKVRWYCLADFTLPFIYDSNVKWLNYKRKIDMYIPYCGWITLSLDQIEDTNIRIYCLPSFSSMMGYFFVSSGNRILWSGQAQIGQQMTYSKDNSRAIRDDNIQFGISTAVSALTLGAGIALAPVTGGISLIPAISAGIGTAGKAVSMMTTRHNDASPQIASSNQGLINYQEPMLRFTNPTLAEDDDVNYRRIYGLPLHKTMALTTLKGSGFTKVNGVKLNGDSFITFTEKQMIISELQNGVIL